MSGWSRIALTVPRVPCTMFSTPLHIQPTLLMSGWSRIAFTVPRVPCTMFDTPLPFPVYIMKTILVHTHMRTGNA